MPRYIVCDAETETEIEAPSARLAAEEWAATGDWDYVVGELDVDLVVFDLSDGPLDEDRRRYDGLRFTVTVVGSLMRRLRVTESTWTGQCIRAWVAPSHTSEPFPVVFVPASKLEAIGEYERDEAGNWVWTNPFDETDQRACTPLRDPEGREVWSAYGEWWVAPDDAPDAEGS